MENKSSDVAWALIGVSPSAQGSKIEEETMVKMMEEAFQEGRKFTLFLCGHVIEEKKATLAEMEEGYNLIRNEMEDYEYGDYGIISVHEEGNLLFFPIEPFEDKENAKDLGGNTDNL